MPQSLNVHEPIFINTLGHSAGLLIFGLLLILLLKESEKPFRLRSFLPALAAILALLWNAGSLLVLTGASTRSSLTEIAAAFSFSALSLMPAVLFSISLGTRAPRLQALGWAASTLAVLLHVSETLFQTPASHSHALLLIAISFIALTAVSALGPGTPDRTRSASRIAGTMALLIFASSFVHFGNDPSAGHAWSKEFALHHAGIPLALFVVLREHRFLLLDVFVRSLASAGLAALFIAAVFLSNARWSLFSLAAQSPLTSGFAVVAACGAVVLFSELRSALQRWLTSRVFRRKSLDLTLQRLANATGTTEPELLAALVQIISDHADARHCERLATPPVHIARGEAIVPFSQGEQGVLLLGRRSGGRPYLSEDLRDLAHLSLVATGRLERFRSEASERLAAQAELRALQSQINPHFLFNSLNALYGTIPRAAADARRTVLNLAEMFRYFLQTDRPMITLSEEVRIIRAYLEIEQLRLGDRLTCRIEVDPQAMHFQIPALSIQPLVENAIRHGVAAKPGPGSVSLNVSCIPAGIRIQVHDTGGGFPTQPDPSANGVGLDNVRQRLRLNYGPIADLQIASNPQGTEISFDVPELQCAR